MKWKGETADGAAVAGTAQIPNLSEENDIDEVEFEVELTSERTAARDKVKELLRKKGVAPVRDQLSKWLSALKTEYSGNLIKPTGASAAAPAPAPAKPAGVKLATTATVTNAAGPVSGAVAGAGAASGPGACKDLKLSDTFKCRAQDLYVALTDEGRVRAYTQSEAKVDATLGGAFALFSGGVTGVFTDLVPYERIGQAWRMAAWPAGHHSSVTLVLVDLGDECRLDLTQTGIPEAAFESVQLGWRTHQWARMKAVLGFGDGLGFSL